MSPSKWLFSTKRAAADVPGRRPRAVAAEPAEGAIVDTVDHVTPGKDQLTAFGGPVVVREIRSRRTSRIDADFNFRPFRVISELLHISACL